MSVGSLSYLAGTAAAHYSMNSATRLVFYLDIGLQLERGRLRNR